MPVNLFGQNYMYHVKKSNFIFLYQDLSGSEYTCPRVNYSDIRVLLHAVELFEFPAFFAIMINLVHSQNNPLVNQSMFMSIYILLFNHNSIMFIIMI